MKTLILVLLAFVVTGAQATPMATVKNKIMTAKELRTFLAERKPASVPKNFLIRKEHNPAAAPIVPIRNAKFKGEIYKFEIKKLPDGTYQYSVSGVCIVNGTAPVFDLRGSPIGDLPPELSESCATAVGGQPATVNLNAEIILSSGQMFTDEAQSDYKSGFPQLTVVVGPNTNQISHGFAFTRDLTQKSMLGYLGTDSIEVCKPAEDGSGDVICTISEGEYFSANVELLD